MGLFLIGKWSWIISKLEILFIRCVWEKRFFNSFNSFYWMLSTMSLDLILWTKSDLLHFFFTLPPIPGQCLIQGPGAPCFISLCLCLDAQKRLNGFSQFTWLLRSCDFLLLALAPPAAPEGEAVSPTISPIVAGEFWRCRRDADVLTSRAPAIISP